MLSGEATNANFDIYHFVYVTNIHFILWFDTINEINENCYTTNNKEFTVQCIYILISMFAGFFSVKGEFCEF